MGDVTSTGTGSTTYTWDAEGAGLAQIEDLRFILLDGSPNHTDAPCARRPPATPLTGTVCRILAAGLRHDSVCFKKASGRFVTVTRQKINLLLAACAVLGAAVAAPCQLVEQYLSLIHI